MQKTRLNVTPLKCAQSTESETTKAYTSWRQIYLGIHCNTKTENGNYWNMTEGAMMEICSYETFLKQGQSIENS